MWRVDYATDEEKENAKVDSRSITECYVRSLRYNLDW